MRKPRDYDAELKALEDRARELKALKVTGLGELVIATGAMPSPPMNWPVRSSCWPKPRTPGRGGVGQCAARLSFAASRGDLHQRLTATVAALKRNRAARNRHQAARARHDMRNMAGRTPQAHPASDRTRAALSSRPGS